MAARGDPNAAMGRSAHGSAVSTVPVAERQHGSVAERQHGLFVVRSLIRTSYLNFVRGSRYYRIKRVEAQYRGR
jgi:hypothetical protein